VSTLDLPALGMKAGDVLRYHVEARDRKNQVTSSKEYQVRIAVDPNSADQQMAAFEKSQDPFEQNLAKLLAEQAQVREKVEKLAEKYAPLMEKIEAAKAEAQDAPRGDPKVADVLNQGRLPNLDTETAKALEALKKELAEIAAKEQQNVQVAQQVGGELARSADQMSKMPMIPRQIADQMKAAQQLFQQMAVPSLQDLSARMNRSADPKQGPPDLKGMEQLGDRVQKELEALRSRLQALTEARRRLRDNADTALSQLQREMQRQNSGLSARELEELRDFLARRQEELKRVEGNQEQLQQETKEAPDKELPAVEKKQVGLDKELEKLLAAAKELLNGDKTRRMNRRDPTFPAEPYTPEAGEQKGPPKEQDTDEPAKKGDKTDPNNSGKPTGKDDKKDDEEESKFMPALGGPKPKVDPRFEKKQRPLAKRPQWDKDDPNARREELQAHQEQNLQDLNQAQQSLSSDQNALEQLLQQLQQELNGKGQGSQGNDADDAAAAQRLSQMMQSPAMQQAMAMAARMRQGQKGSQGQQQPNPGPGTNANLNGSVAAGTLDAELSKLDPATRTVILKMQPRLREELLQGMREEGPEGYRKFIEDYFRRLTEVRGAK
jgi:hypothetical protein